MMMDFDEYIESLLAALVSLQVFEFSFPDIYEYENPIDDSLAFIAQVSDMAPHLKYFALPDVPEYCKRVGGEWVFCDETEYLLFAL
jgi:hypothetical protein